MKISYIDAIENSTLLCDFQKQQFVTSINNGEITQEEFINTMKKIEKIEKKYRLIRLKKWSPYLKIYFLDDLRITIQHSVSNENNINFILESLDKKVDQFRNTLKKYQHLSEKKLIKKFSDSLESIMTSLPKVNETVSESIDSHEADKLLDSLDGVDI